MCPAHLFCPADHTLHSRRFGIKALWAAGLGYNSGVYRNNRDKVVLHTSGSPNHTGDDCVTRAFTIASECSMTTRGT